MKRLWIVLGLVPGNAWAMCSLCRETLRQTGKEGLLNGFYWSILLIGSIPLFVIAFGVYKSIRIYNIPKNFEPK